MDSFLTTTKIGLKLEMEFFFVLARLNLLLKLSISPFLLFPRVLSRLISRPFLSVERTILTVFQDVNYTEWKTKRRKLVNSKLPMLFSLFLSSYFSSSFFFIYLSFFSFFLFSCMFFHRYFGTQSTDKRVLYGKLR